MKKILILTASIIIVISSCKKKDQAPEDTISVTIDGVNENFTKIIYAGIGSTTTASKSHLLITGINPNNNDLIDLEIDASSKIVKGNYSNDVNLPVLVNYGVGNPSKAITEEYQTNGTKINSTAIAITSLSDTKIEGTFSAILDGGSGKPLKTATSGKFNITFK